MTERDQELYDKCCSELSEDEGYYPVFDEKKFADLIRADERARLERSIAELAPVVSNPILQNKPAAFWIESFTQIVREAP